VDGDLDEAYDEATRDVMPGDYHRLWHPAVIACWPSNNWR
jgi:hypothetical protein